MRVALGIEYDGTGYVGWQRQKSGVGVQEPVEKAVTTVANEAVDVVCAGRTDAGVHASGQVVHFDTVAQRSSRGWLLGVNANLPDDINVTWAKPVDDEFHARFSARSRSYRYRILNQLVRSSLWRQRAWWVHEPLNHEAMQAGARLLLGKHDFSSFRAAGCQASTAIREISHLNVERHERWITITITANAFLKHMVRNITGTLTAVGRGDQEPAWVRSVLDCADRTAGGIAAPPQGLTLVDISYPDECDVPRRSGDSSGINVYDSVL